jgi:tripartite-type tricarboxylate transporter receptor subunit TctC
VLDHPEMRARIADMSAAVVGSSPEQFRATWQADAAKWGRVVRETNMHAE